MKIRYDPLTGEFSRNGKVLTPSKDPNGLPVICTGGTKVRAARLAWTLHTRKLPPDDHYVVFRDGDSDNMQFSNLACVPKSIVRRTCKVPVSNVSGHRNVSWMTAAGKWRVQFKVSGMNISAGLFSDINEAVKAAAEARKTLHGVNM